MPKNARKSRLKMRTDDAVFRCIAMNAGSPTGYFRDSQGYNMFLQRTYAEQRRLAREIDAKLSASSTQSSPNPDSDQK